MTDMTTEPKHRSLRSLRTLPEHSATVRTREDRGLLDPSITCLLHEVLGDHRLQPLLWIDRVLHAGPSLCYDGLPDEVGERRSHLGHRQYVLRLDALDRSARHAIDDGLLRILHDGHATSCLDCQQPHAAVVEGPREDDADHPRTVDPGGGAKQRSDRWPTMILARSTGELDPAGADEQMAVRRGDIDASGFNCLAVPGVGGWQRTGPAQNLGEPADGVWRNVNDDHERRWEVRRKARHQGGKSLDAAGGCADHDDVTLGHQSPVCVKTAWQPLISRSLCVHSNGCLSSPGFYVSVLAESSPAGWSDLVECSAYVRHLESKQSSDLGDASGVVADTQGAVMRRSVAAPPIDELGWRQREGDAGGGVTNAQGRPRERLALGGEQFQAAVSGLRHRENRDRPGFHPGLDGGATPPFAMKQIQTTQDWPPFGDGEVEGPVVAHQQEVVDEVHRGKLGKGTAGPEPVHDQHRDGRLGVTLAGARDAASGEQGVADDETGAEPFRGVATQP